MPRVLENLKVTSSVDSQMVGVKQPNSVVMEDIYRNLEVLMNEEPGEMLLCQVSPGNVNPIQRECMFRMPGKQRREPASQFAMYKKSNQCICRKYTYNHAKQVLFTLIDCTFSELERRFTHKMQKSLKKQLDVDKLKQKVLEFKQNLNLNSHLGPRFEQFQQQMKFDTQQRFESSVIPNFLNFQATLQQSNALRAEMIARQPKIQLINDQCKKINEQMEALLLKIRFLVCDDEFVAQFSSKMKEFELHIQKLKDSLEIQIGSATTRISHLEQLKESIELIKKLK